MHNKLRKITKYIQVVENARFCNLKEIEDISYFECGIKKGNDMPPLSSFKKYEKHSYWCTSPDSHAWLRMVIDIPQEMKGMPVMLKISTDNASGWFVDNPQFIAYVDGKMRQGLDTNHRYMILDGSRDSYEIHLYAYTGRKTALSRFYAEIKNVIPAVNDLYYDLMYPFEILSFIDQYSNEYAQIIRYLDSAVTMLELYDVESDEFIESAKRARRFLQDEFYGKFCKEQPMTTILIGHTHIDCAWLWTLEQTREKVQRSFATVVELMKRYPEYKFMSSQPLLYRKLKEEAPEIYEEVKKLVKEGRWEVEGSMWVEADCNLTSGESLVRQIIYGKRFFRDEFGVNTRTLWLPDVFGYSAALPQILKKSGIDWFVTSKISWNDTNMMPFDTFRWKGIDGTKINTYFLTAQDDKGGVPERYTTYVAGSDAKMVSGTWKRYQQKMLNNEVIATFGWGDGGGGPTPEHLEFARRGSKGVSGVPNSKIDFAGNFLKRLEDKIDVSNLVPEWQGELYLEFHRGTYTSIAKNKRNNRKSEFLFLDAELVSVLAKELLGNNFPKNTLRDGWETILTNQFHDIIPGSSIKAVYDRSDIDYARVKACADKIIDSAKSDIASKLDKNCGYVVFNPHSFTTDGLVKANGKSAIAKNIASKGYTCVNDLISTNNVKIDGKTVETNCFTVKFDKDWQITSIYDKKNSREVIKNGKKGNEIRVYVDYPDCYEAWEWEAYSLDNYKSLTELESFETVLDGARVGIKLVRPFMSSKVTQTIWFYDDIAKIDFETVADWHEQNKMVKAVFDVDINTDKATYEIQFGTIERPTHKNTSWDEAKFEVCAQKYADISEGGYGVSIINDCKYGHDIHNGLMQLSLLKCAVDPNPEADQGIMECTYSICPHAGTLAQSDTVKYAYYLNYPMSAVKASGEKSLIPESYSFVSINKENIICETVKEAEESTDTVIRLYECKNIRSKSEITIGFDAKKCYLCDMLENELEEIAINDKKITVDMKGFEIITLKFKK